MSSIELSVVVPCFNEEESLAEFVRRTTLAANAAVGENYEVIFVDDGSSDGTWERIFALTQTSDRIVGVRLSRNHGHQLAVSAGLSVVRGELILILDADLQDPPELVGPMIEMLKQESADVVYGQRTSRAGESRFKTGTAALFYRLLRRFTDVEIPVDTGDFRLMTRRVCDMLIRMPERDRFLRGMVAWLGFKQLPFPYARDARYAGTTKYPLGKMIRFATDAFLGHSMVLLRISGVLAVSLLFLLIIFAIYAVFSWLFLSIEPGWTSSIMLTLIIGAAQLLVLSIVGEYVGRIYLEGKGRPIYIIRDVVRRLND